MPVYNIYNYNEQYGISAETLKRAKKLHKIEVMKKGKKWVWRLVEEKKSDFKAETETPDTVDTLEDKQYCQYLQNR